MGGETVFYMLDEALDMLAPGKLAKLVAQYVPLDRVRPDGGTLATHRSLLDDVRGFDAASRAGRYYESFDVSSRNCMEKSVGTCAFIAECRRLIDRCVAQTKRSAAPETRVAFEVIFRLLRHIDDGHDDVVFFADEGGSWQVGIDWRAVLPAWFRCLARVAEPEEFAEAVVDIVDAFEPQARGRLFAAAGRVARRAQRAALEARVGWVQT